MRVTQVDDCKQALSNVVAAATVNESNSPDSLILSDVTKYFQLFPMQMLFSFSFHSMYTCKTWHSPLAVARNTSAFTLGANKQRDTRTHQIAILWKFYFQLKLVAIPNANVFFAVEIHDRARRKSTRETERQERRKKERTRKPNNPCTNIDTPRRIVFLLFVILMKCKLIR